MNAYHYNNPITRRLNRKAQQRVFLRQAMPWAGAVALVGLYAVMGWPL